MAKIFITGGTGFIGSHLVPRLSRDHEVYLQTSNLLDYDRATQEVLAFSPDILIHLAARTEVEKSFYEQVSFSQVNYVGSVNLIEAAARVPNFKNFLFASTMEVYGWQPISDVVKNGSDPSIKEAFNESTDPNPNAPYAVAKLSVEKYLQYMHRSRDFPFTALRQTNSYGRPDNNFFVTEQAISQMLKNPDQIGLGYQHPWRNFLYIDDLIDAWAGLVENTDKVSNGRIFTIGPDRPIRIRDWAEFIAKKMSWKGEINWDTKPKRPGEIYWLNSDNKLIEKLIGWSPKIDYNTGIDRTIEMWQRNLSTY